MPPKDVPFAVPVEAWNGHVGPAFIRDLAQRLKANFTRDPPGIGLMDDFSVLSAPTFEPERVHELIREFYEHTSRFVLSVRPVWHGLYLPLFWLFRRYFARNVGQFNLPFDEREAKRGIETHIDALDLNHDKIVDLRGWVRTYAGTDTVIYVGVYTAIRINGVGYVSVGFPLPNANLTATLIPSNVAKHDFLLRTKAKGVRYAGDYIVLVDETTGDLNVFRIRGLREEIHVYVRDGALFTDHRFYFLGGNFLTLHYSATHMRAAAERPGAVEPLDVGEQLEEAVPLDAAALLDRSAAAVAQHGNPITIDP